MSEEAWWVVLWVFSTVMAALFAWVWIRALNSINEIEEERDRLWDRCLPRSMSEFAEDMAAMTAGLDEEPGDDH
jgi:hypothetical protein